MLSRTFTMLLLTLFSHQIVLAQCGIAVDAGPDQGVCDPGDNVNLNGMVSGSNILSTIWSPESAVADPNSLNTTAFVSSPMTFTLTVQVVDPSTNLIENGDFNAGLSGFYSDYVEGTGGTFGTLSNEGEYAVTTNSSLVHNNFAACTDHTGGGNMLVVNGATDADANIWCQDISISPFTDYVFSFWGQTVISENPGILQFNINGFLQGVPFNLPTGTCQWEQFSASWFSGNNTTATLCITNQNTQGSGNDFAIDDILFSEVCEQTDEMFVDVITLDATLDPVLFLPCTQPPGGFMLDGTNSSTGPNITYEWTTNDGNIVSGSNSQTATIDAPGTYDFDVIYDDGTTTCTHQASIEVYPDPDVPEAFPVAFDDIDCNQTPVTITGGGSTQGQNYIYEWTTNDGNIITDPTNFDIVVDAAGTYTILVTNTANGCTAEGSSTVNENMNLPDAAATVNGNLDCINDIINLSGDGSSEGDFSYEWTTNDGNILNGENTLNPVVDMIGTYSIVVTDNSNGCTNSAEVTVMGDMTPPDAIASSPNDFDCQNTTMELDGNGSATGDVSYEWTTNDGNILNGENTLTPTIDMPGTYTILVTNNENGCTNTDEVTVTGNVDLPDAFATVNDDLDCDNAEVTLDGTGSSTGDVAYEWTTMNGNILDGNTTLMPNVNATGTYILTVTDNQTGCTNTAEVTVEGSTGLPMAAIEMPMPINCNNDPVILDASNSSSMGNFVYQWSTPDGSFSDMSNILMVEVNMIGTYILIVTNEDNGCTATTSAMVTLDDTAADVAIETPDFIDCSGNEVMITANNMTTASGFLYEWNTADGNLTSGAQSLTPSVDAVGTYTLTVTNQDTGCTADFSVEIEPDADVPMVEFEPADSLTCSTNSVIINAQNSSSGGDYSFEWSTMDGNFVAGENTLQPEIDATGTYTLTIVDNSNNCETSETITITENMEMPTVEAGNSFILNCDNPTGNLDLMGSNTGTNFNILWETTNGNITTDPTTENPIIDQPGNYILTITNTENGCIATDSVEITDDFAMPNADAGLPVEITCAESILNLNGENSSMGNDFSYEWSTINGNITQGENSLNPAINAAGDYQLIVTNTMNGCTATSMVAVTENADFPNVDAGQTMELTCDLTEINLAGNGSQGNEFTYQWTTTDGNIVQNDDTLTPTINDAGEYQLVVTNTQNDCSATANVVITADTTPPDLDAGDTFELSCSITEANLNGSTSGMNFSYNWTTTNGNILADNNTLTPTINAPGIYELTVTNPDNGCTANDQIEITQDANAPIADAGMATPITCMISTIELDASNSSNSPTISYSWATSDGNILNGQNTLNPQINEPGTYILTVLDSANDCETISSVTIEENTELPTAEAGENNELTCIETMLTLNAENSSQGTEFLYEWSTNDGNILNGENTLNPEIDAAGIYQILITNTETGCTNTDELEITENQLLPTISNNTPNEINCINESVIIDGNGTSIGNEFSYEWTTSNGEIVTGETTLSPEVNSAGIYTLLVTNSDNGCTASGEVEVIENINLPNVEAGQNQTLTCTISNLNLDGNGTSMGNEFSYQWTTQNGQILNGTTTLNPEIDAAGFYQLLVTNTENGCTAIDEVEVLENTVSPMISIANPDDLTCVELLVDLDATNSDNGTNFQYEWTTTNGNITSGENTLTPKVDETGSYILTILNTENGCTATANVTVEEDILLPTVEAGATQMLNCNLQSTTLEGSGNGIGNLSFEWETMTGNISSGDDSPTPTINQPGIYSLIVTDQANGCTNTDDVEITEIVLNDFTFSTEDANCVIPTGSVNFGTIDGGQSPFLYSIDGGQNFAQNTSFFELQPDNYEIVIQDANGCELADDAFILEATDIELALESQVILKLGTTYQINLQSNIPSNSITEINWSPAIGLSCADCLNPVASPTQATTYTVNITDENGCMASAKIVFLINKDVDVHFPNVFSPNQDGSNETFYPQSRADVVANIPSFQIFDRWGEVVYELYNFSPNDPSVGWDGIYRGELMNPAVFIFVAEVEFVDGRTEVFRGDFTLLR